MTYIGGYIDGLGGVSYFKFMYMNYYSNYKLKPGYMEDLYMHIHCMYEHNNIIHVFHRIMHSLVGGVVSYCELLQGVAHTANPLGGCI